MSDAACAEASLETEARRRPVRAWIGAVVLAQSGLALAIGFPGQLSVDSIVQLYEGRAHRFIDVHPPLMSILLGALDTFTNAPAAFVLISTALLAAATWLVLIGTGRARAWQRIAATVLVLDPVLLIYAGIVWKDVLLAHAVVFLYFLLAALRDRRHRIGLAPGIAILVLLFTIAGVRQQGALFAIPAGAWAATLVRRPNSRIGFALVIVLCATLPSALSRALEMYVRSFPDQPAVTSVGTGFRILIAFDLAGIAASGGNLPQSATPALVDEVRHLSQYYSSYGIDRLRGPADAYWAMGDEEARELWWTTVAANAGAYLRHRGRYFLALLGFADMRECTPVFSGIAGPVVHRAVGADLDAILGLQPGPRPWSNAVNGFGWDMANTPLFMHWVSALMVLAVGPWLVRRRKYVLLTLAACSLLLLGSYFVLGIACDFRYAYVLTASAVLLVAYAVLRLRHPLAPSDSDRVPAGRPPAFRRPGAASDVSD